MGWCNQINKSLQNLDGGTPAGIPVGVRAFWLYCQMAKRRNNKCVAGFLRNDSCYWQGSRIYEGKQSTVTVVNDSPVGCQSRDRVARRGAHTQGVTGRVCGSGYVRCLFDEFVRTPPTPVCALGYPPRKRGGRGCGGNWPPMPTPSVDNIALRRDTGDWQRKEKAPAGVRRCFLVRHGSISRVLS